MPPSKTSSLSLSPRDFLCGFQRRGSSRLRSSELRWLGRECRIALGGWQQRRMTVRSAESSTDPLLRPKLRLRNGGAETRQVTVHGSGVWRVRTPVSRGHELRGPVDHPRRDSSQPRNFQSMGTVRATRTNLVQKDQSSIRLAKRPQIKIKIILQSSTTKTPRMDSSGGKLWFHYLFDCHATVRDVG